MKTINKEEEREICILVEQLFSCIAKPTNFEAVAKIIDNKWKGISFSYSQYENLKYKTKTDITADSIDAMRLFLSKEKGLAIDSKEFEKAAQIRDLLNNQRGLLKTNYFKLSYDISNIGKEIIVTFNTNSSIFKNYVRI